MINIYQFIVIIIIIIIIIVIVIIVIIIIIGRFSPAPWCFSWSWSSASTRDISQVARQQFSLLLTLLNTNQPSPPSFLGRYSLATLLLLCKQPFTANTVLVFLSILISPSNMQSTIPTL